MKYPQHCDERAHKFFYSAFVGKGIGDDGTSYRTHLDNGHPELEATATYEVPSKGNICVYCGSPARAIQPWIDRGDYSVYGYACVCKGAMDELEFESKLVQMRERHVKELALLSKEKPSPDAEVQRRVLDLIAKSQSESLLQGALAKRDYPRRRRS